MNRESLLSFVVASASREATTGFVGPPGPAAEGAVWWVSHSGARAPAAGPGRSPSVFPDVCRWVRRDPRLSGTTDHQARYPSSRFRPCCWASGCNTAVSKHQLPPPEGWCLTALYPWHDVRYTLFKIGEAANGLELKRQMQMPWIALTRAPVAVWANFAIVGEAYVTTPF